MYLCGISEYINGPKGHIRLLDRSRSVNAKIVVAGNRFPSDRFLLAAIPGNSELRNPSLEKLIIFGLRDTEKSFSRLRQAPGPSPNDYHQNERALVQCSPFDNPQMCMPPLQPGQYRLPHCAAFLRPTEPLQSPDARMVSSGQYLPLCAVNAVKKSTKEGNDVLYREDIFGCAVTPQVFEELLNHEMLGSRALSFDEIEQFYKRHQIMRPTDSMLFHAQTIDY